MRTNRHTHSAFMAPAPPPPRGVRHRPAERRIHQGRRAPRFIQQCKLRFSQALETKRSLWLGTGYGVLLHPSRRMFRSCALSSWTSSPRHARQLSMTRTSTPSSRRCPATAPPRPRGRGAVRPPTPPARPGAAPRGPALSRMPPTAHGALRPRRRGCSSTSGGSRRSARSWSTA